MDEKASLATETKMATLGAIVEEKGVFSRSSGKEAGDAAEDFCNSYLPPRLMPSSLPLHFSLSFPFILPISRQHHA